MYCLVHGKMIHCDSYALLQHSCFSIFTPGGLDQVALGKVIFIFFGRRERGR